MEIGHTIYLRQSAEAVDMYCRVFGLTLGYHVKNADGSYFHSELLDDGKPILSVVEADAGDLPQRNDIVCLGLTLADADTVRRTVPLLAEGGTIRMPLTTLPWSPCCAQVVDRFGVWWYLTAPQHRPEDSFSPDGFTYPE